MKWAVEIKGSCLDRRNLSDLLSGLGFTLVETMQRQVLTSSKIDASATAADAFEIAKSIRDAFTGAAQIDPTFALGSVFDYSVDPPRSFTFVELSSIAMTMSMGVVTVSTSSPAGLSDVELEKWNLDNEERQYQTQLERQRSMLEPAFVSAKASKMLEMLALKDPSGEVIYKIYELAEGQSSDRKSFHLQYGILTNEFDRFKDAVHNPNVTGDWARHANPQRLNSGNPMTKNEAEQFVRGIAAKWLAHVRTTKLPYQILD